MDDLTRRIDVDDAALLQAMPDAGCDVDSVYPRYGYPALYLAVHLDRRESLSVLLSAAANVNRRFDLWEGMGGTRGATALWGVRSPEVLDVLLEAGADPDPADERGVTPLMLTALTRLGGGTVLGAHQVPSRSGRGPDGPHEGRTVRAGAARAAD